jgi:hypothetical protein
MGNEQHEPSPDGDDEDSILARLSVGLPTIVGDMDQLEASLVGYAKCTNAVYQKLLEGGFPERRAEKMAAELWGYLIVPYDGEGEE